MAKMRVYDLAKELSVTSKDIIAFLGEKGIEVKAASSNIDDDAIASARKKFSSSAEEAPAKKSAAKKAAAEKAPVKEEAKKATVKKAAAPEKVPAEKTAAPEKAPAKKAVAEKSAEKVSEKSEEKPAEKPAVRKAAPSGEKKEAAAAEKKAAPKKKSSISAVFNAQYSKSGSSSAHDTRSRNTFRRDRAHDGASSGFRDDSKAHRIIKPRTDGDRVIRPRGTMNVPDHQETAAPVSEQNVVPAESPAAEASAKAEVRPKGEGTVQKNEENAPAKDRARTIVRGNIYDGNGGPAAAKRPSADRGPARGHGDDRRAHSEAGGKRRGSAGRDAFAHGQQGGQPGAAPAEGRKGQFSKGAKKKKAEHDVLGSKKQERLVNLEKTTGHNKHRKPVNRLPERNQEEILSITIPDRLTVKDLAEKMLIKPADVVKNLFMKGKMATLNSEVTFEEAEEIALEYNCILEREEKIDVIADLLKEEEEDERNMVPRSPVVCVMGHVDHGKTSLLDAIRDTKVTDREAGGITQKIGAYVVNVKGRKITFLDTPGHEAFTAMRMRGASSTDIAILVVAADDGVMPQTVEAINHAKAAGVEIIVAVNKIDKPSANIERVKQELSEYELIPEDWGGSTIFVPVSAHTHAGIDDLLDMILLTADVLELKADPKRNARGIVIEAELDKGRGVVATVLVQKGTLHIGDPVAAGSCSGKVRAMLDENARHLKKAGPSTPVEIQGLSDVPNAGEIFMSFNSEKEAHSFADTFVTEEKKALIDETRSRMSLDGLFSKIKEGKVKELDIIVKADVQGSVEAVKQSLEKLSNEEVVVKVIHGGVGAINESDVTLAAASNAVIIGFNVRPDAVAKQTADTEGVDLRLYNVIYNAIADVEDAMKGMLEPVYEEKVIGHAEVRAIFKSSDVGNIAGSYVLDGNLERDCKARITRGGDQIFDGKLISLKRFKDDVKEVKAGFECGLVFEGFGEFAEGDQIEAYKMVEVPRN